MSGRTTDLILTDFQALCAQLCARGLTEEDLHNKVTEFFNDPRWWEFPDEGKRPEPEDNAEEDSNSYHVYLNLEYVIRKYGEPSKTTADGTKHWFAIARLPPGVTLILDNPCIVKQDNTYGFRLVSDNSNHLDLETALETLTDDYKNDLKHQPWP